MVVKISSFFIFRFSHRNGIIFSEAIAMKLYTTIGDVQMQRGAFFAIHAIDFALPNALIACYNCVECVG